MIQANSVAITAAVFPPEERGTALGLNGTIVAAGLVAGPTVGGLITDALGWRWVFYIAIPVGLLAIPFAHGRPARERHIASRDACGVSLSTGRDRCCGPPSSSRSSSR